MIFFRRHPPFGLLKCLLALACLVFVWMAPSVGNGKSKRSDPIQLPDEAMNPLIAMGPDIVYPDAQRMTDVSGHLTAIFKAGGSFTFRTQDQTKSDKLDLTMTVAYQRSGKSELITTAVQGARITTYDTPSGTHKVETITWSGSETRPGNGFCLHKFVWSKELNLACFDLGLQVNANGLQIPCNAHMEWISKDEKQSMDAKTILMAVIPSYGTSDTRFAKLVGSGLFQENYNGAVFETPSAQGTSSGSFTMPIFFDGFSSWHTETTYKTGGTDPRKPPQYMNDDIIWQGSVQVLWAFGDKMPEGKMSLAAADQDAYRSWYPIPVDDDRFGLAARLEFTARIEPKEKGKPAPKGKIHFWLNDVSRQKGKCGNFPVDGAAKDDLRFAPDQAGIIIDPANPRHAYTEKVCDTAAIEVEALDTGAYGAIQATCDDLGLVAEDERTKLQSISIPLDDNHNHIADAWEKTMGIYQQNYLATDDDDNQPAGQRRSGDGYTVYEEYRGFMTRDGFVRTDPLKKDLFIYDPDGLVKQWYEPYNPAKLVLHYIDPTMMKFNGNAQDPENRRINCNSSEDNWYARQYAMVVKQWATMSGGTVGEASDTFLADQLNNISAQGDSFDQPLKRFYIVKVAPGTLEKTLAGVKNSAVKQDIYSKVMATTVIHEMGHAMGIRHHRDANRETEISVSGGVFDCAMRYNTPAEYLHPELFKAQTRYCVKGETWEKTTRDGFTDMPSDNCFGQIDVKSDP